MHALILAFHWMSNKGYLSLWAQAPAWNHACFFFTETKAFQHPVLCPETSVPWIKFKGNCYSFSTVLDSRSFEDAHEFCKREGNSSAALKRFHVLLDISVNSVLSHSDFRSMKTTGGKNTIEFAYWGDSYHRRSMFQCRLGKPEMVPQCTAFPQNSSFWSHVHYEFLMFSKLDHQYFSFLSESLYSFINVISP